MDHTEAVAKGAIERYQLGELSGTELDEFETHFFECADCAEELREAAVFEENAKAVFLENSRRAAGAGEPRAKYEQAQVSWWALFWRNPWSAAPALAAAGLLCVVVVQDRSIKQALAPQTTVSFTLHSTSRGDQRVIKITKNIAYYTLDLEEMWGTHSEYFFTVQDEKGPVRWSRRIPAPPADKPIQISVRRNTLPSGRYTVIVHSVSAAGQPETELARYSLILKLD
jgi:hypothetical protein